MIRIADTLTNLAANLGLGKSKVAADRYGLTLLDDGQLEAMYRGDWVARKAIRIPVDDMMRPWRDWQASPEQITAIEEAERRHDVRAKITKAMLWARLYGGAAIVLGDGNLRPDQPLDPLTLPKGGLKYLTVLPKRWVNSREMELDVRAPGFGTPRMYTISSSQTAGIDVHPSRIIPVIGAEVPGIDSNVDGWGDSILQAIYDAIHHVSLSTAAGAELVHEAKLDVIKIPNLEGMLATDAGTEAVAKRFRAASMLKSINNTLLLGTGEEYERKDQSFAGLTDIVRLYLQIVAGATDIPATRLIGQAPGGLNASGDSDTRNYYDMLDGRRKTDLKAILDRLDPILWRDQTGNVPTEAFYEFGPLWQPTAAEKATTSKTKAETTKIYAELGLLPEDALAVGAANQLIEDGVYPGAEEALAKVQSAPDGFGEEPAPKAPPGRAAADRRKRLSRA